jgi:phosphatidylglycerol lysyltransferase
MQGAERLTDASGQSGWLARPLPGALVAIGPPKGAAQPQDLAALAALRDAAPILYKCDGRTAARARRAGWRVAAIATEAWIAPQTWSIGQPGCARLRRKLRQADAAGLRVVSDPECLPFDAMTTISTAWARRNGGERGFSMGRFDRAYVGGQRVFLAYRGATLVGFVTFHVTSRDWALDLIRHAETAPNGTIQALLVAAIAAARGAGASGLSLAAAPLVRAGQTPCGLWQLKHAFAPRMVTRYHAAPGPLRFVASLGLIALAVHRPDWFAGTRIARRRGGVRSARPQHSL